MKSIRPIVSLVLATGFVAGCAAPTTGPKVDPDDKVYVTGSRIPRSDAIGSGVRSTSDPNDIRTMTRPPVAGGGGN